VLGGILTVVGWIMFAGLLTVAAAAWGERI